MGLRYFGLLGLLIGPLAISYFFELIRMYRVEYLEDEDLEVSSEQLAAVERRLTPRGTRVK
jgi:predicted PurR-regulated permease PerM